MATNNTQTISTNSTSSTSTSTTRSWKWFHTAILVAIVILIALISVTPWPLVKGDRGSALLTWWIIMGLLVLSVLILGAGIAGNWLGILIDQRNKMSLSRLQVVLWTILILSAWITASLWNLQQGVTDPLGINVPVEVWALLGISGVSFVAQPLILNVKQNQTSGAVDTNDSKKEASPDDMFKGDDQGNANYIDLSKVQMFFFTIVLVLTYGAALGQMFLSPQNVVPLPTLATGAQAPLPPQYPLGIWGFPLLSAGMITLLALSHAGYLAYKAVPHPGPSEPDGSRGGQQPGE
jgi:hypothetical protein